MLRAEPKLVLTWSLVFCLVLAGAPTVQVQAGQATLSGALKSAKAPQAQKAADDYNRGTNGVDFFVIDPVSPGSLSEWEPFLDPRNPEFTYEEITGDYVEGTAIRTSVVGDTIMQCRTQHISRHFNLSGNTLETKLKAYLEFEFSGSYYNLPMVQIYLYDEAGEEIDNRIYYGKDIVGGYHLDVIFPNERYIELPDNKGDLIIDLSHFDDFAFSSFDIRLRNYTCIGTNSIVFDNLRIANAAESPIFRDRFELAD